MVVPIEAVLVPTVTAVVPVGAEALAKFVEAVPVVLDSIRVVETEEFAVVEWVQFVATAAVVVIAVVAAEVFAVVAIVDLFEQVVIDSFEIVVAIVAAAEKAISLPEIGLSVAEPCEAVALIVAPVAVLIAVPAAAEDN